MGSAHEFTLQTGSLAVQRLAELTVVTSTHTDHATLTPSAAKVRIYSTACNAVLAVCVN